MAARMRATRVLVFILLLELNNEKIQGKEAVDHYSAHFISGMILYLAWGDVTLVKMRPVYNKFPGYTWGNWRAYPLQKRIDNQYGK